MHTKNKSKQNHERTGSTNHRRRRKDKESESNIDSAPHKPLNNKNNEMIRITIYLSILTLNVNRINCPIKRHHLANWIKKKDGTSVVYRRPTSLTDTSTGIG
jgi:hypothetical protein